MLYFDISVSLQTNTFPYWACAWRLDCDPCFERFGSFNSYFLFPDEIKKLFPSLFGQPSAILVPSENESSGQALKVGVVLSGGQAPGGHNVISGIFGKDLSTCIYSGSISWFIYFFGQNSKWFSNLDCNIFLLGLELCKADILDNYYSLFWMDENYFLFGPGLKITCRSVAREAQYMDLGVDQLE